MELDLGLEEVPEESHRVALSVSAAPLLWAVGQVWGDMCTMQCRRLSMDVCDSSGRMGMC